MSLPEKYGNIAVVLGTQWGDEGKGKLVDIFAQEYGVIVRATGGANAGHTIYFDHEGETKKVVFHLLPSGMLHKETIGVIGNGCVIHLQTLAEEIASLKEHGLNVDGRLWISDRAHIVCDFHKMVDGASEDSMGEKKIGTTKRGIGPAYGEKMFRNGLRVADLYDFETFEVKLRENLKRWQKQFDFEYDIEADLKTYKELAEYFKPFVRETATYLHQLIKDGTPILVEGANGALLDIDHGTYPFVTSSNSTIGGIATGTGIAPQSISTTIGILKAYTTRVGAGPFPTELTDEVGETLQREGHEYGATTKRPRRCGWFDAVLAKYTFDINGISMTNLTKIDVMNSLETIKICTRYKGMDGIPARSEDFESAEPEYIEMPGWQEDISECSTYEELPENCRNYIEKIEELIGVSIDYIGIGPKRGDMIKKES